VLKRRQVLTTGAVGGLIGAMSGATPAAATAQGSGSASDRMIERVADAIGELRAELRQERQFTEIAPIREAQKVFLRSNGKLPDFIDVGADVWFQVYDWHVRWQQPLAESRDAQGRLMLAVNHTFVLLRSDVLENYIGLPYDAR
jgi:hypothetical protein